MDVVDGDYPALTDVVSTSDLELQQKNIVVLKVESPYCNIICTTSIR